MHFWINKPAGRYYDFTGRQYPATPRPKSRISHCRYIGEPRQTITPLRRFRNLNTMGNTAGPSNSFRMIRTTIRTNNETQSNLPAGSTQRPQQNNNSNNVTTAGNNQLILSNTTSNETNESLSDFSEFDDAEFTSYRLRRRVWVIFILATGFVSTGKYYLTDRGQIIELFVFWGLLILVLYAFLYSIVYCQNRCSQNHRQRQIQEEHIASVTATTSMPNENIRQNPPPPYHIAILIPSNNPSEEAPPPSYDKIMR